MCKQRRECYRLYIGSVRGGSSAWGSGIPATRLEPFFFFKKSKFRMVVRADQFGYMFTRLAYKNNVLTKQWLVFKSRTILVDDDSESD